MAFLDEIQVQILLKSEIIVFPVEVVFELTQVVMLELELMLQLLNLKLMEVLWQVALRVLTHN